MRKRAALLAAATVAGAGGLVVFLAPAGTAAGPDSGFDHLVVIYEENHSFDNLYAGWGSVNGQQVDGVAAPDYAAHSTQVGQSGSPISCLFVNDANLATSTQKFYWIGEPTSSAPSHPGHLTPACSLTLPNGGASADSHFASSAPFSINDYLTPADTSCAPAGSAPASGVLARTVDPVNGDPAGVAGGCTRDIVHRFYQEQYQIDGGRQDRYPTGSDATGLTMGRYDTTTLPIYQYLTGAGAPNYVIADHFFQGAFGGSFLNHQFLVAGRAPYWPSPPSGRNSRLDSAGFPNRGYPLYAPLPAATYADGALAQPCPAAPRRDVAGLPIAADGRACGNYAVNTVQPGSWPSGALRTDGTVRDPANPPLPLINDTNPTGANYEPNIGDRLSAKNVSWAWYAGGWNDAVAGHPDPLFQYHHQPLDYFANYAPGKPGRSHLKDETGFLADVNAGNLPSVSFVKPLGTENEHPGYSSTATGDAHLVDLLKAIEAGPQADRTLVVVTYDEFGGQWDHVSPPGQGNANGPHDSYGPGTRIPAIVLGRPVQHSGVDSTSYDTTSIMRAIELKWGLPPLGYRDSSVNPVTHALGGAAPTVDAVMQPDATAGRSVTLSGTGPAASDVVLEYQDPTTGNAWRQLTVATSDAGGAWSHTFAPGYITRVRASNSAGNATVEIRVKVKVTIDRISYVGRDSSGLCVTRFQGGTYPYIPGAQVWIRNSAVSPSQNVGAARVTRFGASGRYDTSFRLVCGRSYRLFSLVSGRGADGVQYADNGTGPDTSYRAGT